MRPDVPIIMITAYGDGETKQKALERRREAEKQAAARRALDPQVKVDAHRLVTEWNERQALVADAHRGRDADRARAKIARRMTVQMS